MDKKNEIIKEYQERKLVKNFDQERSKFIFHNKKHEFESKIINFKINLIQNKKIKILDIACGTGRIFQELTQNKKDIDYIGLDTSKEMLKELKKKYAKHTNISLILSDASKIPFKNNNFDITYSYHLLWHLPEEEQEKIIKEMIRVTKKGGIVIFDALNKDFLWEKIKFIVGRKKDKNMYKMDIRTIKTICSQNSIAIEKFLDIPIKNKIIFRLFNVINKLRYFLPNQLFHIIYFSIEVK